MDYKILLISDKQGNKFHEKAWISDRQTSMVLLIKLNKRQRVVALFNGYHPDAPQVKPTTTTDPD